jgi:hypothetical protein
MTVAPDGRGGGHAAYDFTAAEDRAGADKANARKNAQRQAHHVESDDRNMRVGHVYDQPVGLDHRHRRRHGDQDGGAQASRVRMLPAIQADQGAGDECACETQQDVGPRQCFAYRVRNLLRPEMRLGIERLPSLRQPPQRLGSLPFQLRRQGADSRCKIRVRAVG